LEVLPGSCDETSVTSPDDAHDGISIKVEEGTGIHIKEEEITEPISFPLIKAEPDEVSYMAVCPLLDTFL
jgi:hypothetical protein